MSSVLKLRKLNKLFCLDAAALIAENVNYLQALIIKVKAHMKKGA